MMRGILLAIGTALLALFAFWYGAQPALILAGLPLLLTLLFVAHGTRTAIACCGFLAFAYLAHGITELTANPAARLYASAELALSLCLLAASSVTLRSGRKKKD